jgi:hypothetical protein
MLELVDAGKEPRYENVGSARPLAWILNGAPSDHLRDR